MEPHPKMTGERGHRDEVFPLRGLGVHPPNPATLSSGPWYRPALTGSEMGVEWPESMGPRPGEEEGPGQGSGEQITPQLPQRKQRKMNAAGPASRGNQSPKVGDGGCGNCSGPGSRQGG